MHPGDSHSESSLTRYFRQIGRSPLLSHREILDLIPRIRQGDMEARERLIRSHLRLVVWIAKGFGSHDLPLPDAIQEGNKGLMRAVDLFQPEKGSRFSYYATLWIKQAIRRALENQSRTIRNPSHSILKLGRLHREESRLASSLERPPTEEELARAMGIPAGKVRQIRSMAAPIVSLDAPAQPQEEGLTLGECLPDRNARDPYSRLDRSNRSQILSELISKLPEREYIVLKHRFGLDGIEAQSLVEVGKLLGITRERVRQIQCQTQSKLRRWMRKCDAVRPAID